jgi:hypothetical protein
MAKGKGANSPAGKGKVKTRVKEVIKSNGKKVKIFNFSPLEYFCALESCGRKLGRTNTMVVFHKGEYYCDFPCSNEVPDE